MNGEATRRYLIDSSVKSYVDYAISREVTSGDRGITD